MKEIGTEDMVDGGYYKVTWECETDEDWNDVIDVIKVISIRHSQIDFVILHSSDKGSYIVDMDYTMPIESIESIHSMDEREVALLLL